MLLVVIGITYGIVVGFLGNWLMFRQLDRNRQSGAEPLKGIGAVFFIRYILDAVSLLAFGFLMRDKWAIIAAAVSVTMAVKVSLLIVYTRKGGRFD